MALEDAEQEARLRRALDKLSREFLHHPDVSLIDIGLRIEQGRITDEVVLRIHVRKRASPTGRWPFPEQVDGIPVVVMYGDYKPEADVDDE